ncbi:MAG: hypothetical protein PHG20_09040, partial [Geobacteraceae bacterium]|nr:hypothetical protein [Geobacteraceae bacterium]
LVADGRFHGRRRKAVPQQVIDGCHVALSIRLMKAWLIVIGKREKHSNSRLSVTHLFFPYSMCLKGFSFPWSPFSFLSLAEMHV